MNTEDLFAMVLNALEQKNGTVTEQRRALVEWENKWREMRARVSRYKEIYRGRSVEAVAALEALQQDIDMLTIGRYPADAPNRDDYACTPVDLG